MKFQKKLVPLLFLPIFLLVRLTRAIDFDEGCFTDGNTGGSGNGGNNRKNVSLKLAFVIDQTHSFDIGKRVFTNAIIPLVLALKTLYVRVEVALTMFADWPRSAEPDVGVILEELGNRPHNLAEGCYARRREFQENYVSLSQLLRDIKPIPNGGRESSLAAMAMTAVDKFLLWDASPNGQRVRKVIMVLTERSYGNISKPGTRQDFKGDGTDTCRTSKPPPVSQVGEILAKNGIAVIAIIPPSLYEQNALQWYVDHIGQLPTVPFCGREFNLIQGFDLVTIVNFVRGCLLGFEDGDGGNGGGGSTGNSTGGGGDKQQCVFGDPPGFNTLGL